MPNNCLAKEAMYFVNIYHKYSFGNFLPLIGHEALVLVYNFMDSRNRRKPGRAMSINRRKPGRVMSMN